MPPPATHPPFDVRFTPHVPADAVKPDPAPPPVILGGVLSADSAFLDATPAAAFLDGASGLISDQIVPKQTAATSPTAAPAVGFDRAAVERVRARAAHPAERVEATVTSDDGVADHVADITPWLAGASVRELRDLVADGWGGDSAVEVAESLADDEPEVADVLRHARRADSGIVVEIDVGAATAWLAAHRPDAARALDLDE